MKRLRYGTLWGVLLATGLVIGVQPPVSAETAPDAKPTKKQMQWVALANAKMNNWMENANRLDRLLKGKTKEEAERLKAELMEAKTYQLEVRTAADPHAPCLGTIVITASPKDGLSATFCEPNREPVAFTPDLYDPDWDYGPWFHQTALGQKGEWFLLPRNPLPRQGWVDLSCLGAAPRGESVVEKRIYMLGKRSIVIVGSDGKTVSFRDEQPADYWCDAAPIPPIKPAKITRVPYSHLFTKDGHLRLKVKYTRGCWSPFRGFAGSLGESGTGEEGPHAEARRSRRLRWEFGLERHRRRGGSRGGAEVAEASLVGGSQRWTGRAEWIAPGCQA